ncbi:MAG: hypothetical protein F4100_08350 [Rhodothermaceae bacterium]|nr:hypothetical protein [Rhodothermaceae bacterium]MYE62634.1 hypothetical protein [Rhodothermaceae bacterium]MYJ20732.1 hypothetical protein [Rhodothermaceae bacterium]
MKDHKTKHTQVEIVEDTTKPRMQGFINETRSIHAPVFTDEHLGLQGMSNRTSVKHGEKK